MLSISWFGQRAPISTWARHTQGPKWNRNGPLPLSYFLIPTAAGISQGANGRQRDLEKKNSTC